MNVGINAGFGDSLAAEFDGLAAYGFAVARQDVFAHHDPNRIAPLVTEFLDAPVRALFLIGGGKIQRADGSARLEPHELAAITTSVVESARSVGLTEYAIEIGNEPDLAHPDYSDRPRDFVEAIRQCHEAARAHGFTGTIVVGGVSNLNDRGFDYLADMLAAPPSVAFDDVVIGFHRYPEAGRGPMAPHKHYQSRTDEYDTLVGLVAGRPVACTEFGYHTAGGRPLTLTDEGVAAAVLWDLAFYDERGVRLACVYQLSDGPTDDYLDRYGVRTLDGTWKPVARRIRDTYGSVQTL